MRNRTPGCSFSYTRVISVKIEALASKCFDALAQPLSRIHFKTFGCYDQELSKNCVAKPVA
jgi:hypothetical protein